MPLSLKRIISFKLSATNLGDSSYLAFWYYDCLRGSREQELSHMYCRSKIRATVLFLLNGFTTAKATKKTVLYSKAPSRTAVLKVDFSEMTVERAKVFNNTVIFIFFS